MVKIDGYDIELTRGDSLYLRVDLSGRELPEGTDAVFTVKKNVRSDEVLVRKRFDASDEILEIRLSGSETRLAPGVYVWDVRLQIPQENGLTEVYTPMDYAAFVVLSAVGEPIGENDDDVTVDETLALKELRAALAQTEAAAKNANEMALEAQSAAVAIDEKVAQAAAPLTETVNKLSWEVDALRKDEQMILASEQIAVPALLNKAEDVKQTVSGSGIQICNVGNVFNKAAWKPNLRYDNNGNIISDNSSGYVDQLIPVINGKLVYANVPVQTFYFFDKNKNFIKRAGYMSTPGRWAINVGEDIAYVMFQFSIAEVETNLDSVLVTFLENWNESIPVDYVPFTAASFSQEDLFTGKNLVFSDTASTATLITYDLTADYYSERTEELFSSINMWEPDTVDEGYSNPTNGSGRDTRREDWTAENRYTYYDFLAAYYDHYVGIHEDGYRVVKTSLGQDCGKSGHEIFEFDFCPVNYKYTVLLSAGMNADETQGIWALATFMRCVMGREEASLSIAKDNIRFKVIPVVNASGFDQPLLSYKYLDGVNPNFNFNHRNSWFEQTSTDKGEYPDSNIATIILKKWLNDNSGRADLWLDLHTGRWNVSAGTNKKIMDIRLADSSMSSVFSPYVAQIKQYYIQKGFITADDDAGGISVIRGNVDYQKSAYAFDVCAIPSIMPEMHLESTGYGADGYTNNSPEGIKCYVLQIRAMVMVYVNAASGRNCRLDNNKAAKFHQRYL